MSDNGKNCNRPPVVSPAVLDVGSLAQGEQVTRQVHIKNDCTGPMLWKADEAETRWVSLSERSGTLQNGEERDIDVVINTHELPEGCYTATLAFTSIEEDSSVSTQVLVMLRVGVAAPAPQVLAFNAAPAMVLPLAIGLFFDQDQHTSRTQQLALVNWHTTQPMNWKADTMGTNWLSVDPSTGVLQPREQHTLHVSANSSSLEIGDYNSTLTIETDTAGARTTFQGQATLHVNPQPYGDNGPKAPTVQPPRLDFGIVQPHGSAAQLVITNTEAIEAVNWTLSTGVTWVTVTLSDGVLNAAGRQSIGVTVHADNLRSATYQVDLLLTVRYANPALVLRASTTVIIPVTMVVP